MGSWLVRYVVTTHRADDDCTPRLSAGASMKAISVFDAGDSGMAWTGTFSGR